jgi:hypothetical protein
MQLLQFALFIVLLELTVGSFVSLYLLDLRGDTSRNFVKFQGILYLIFAFLTLLAMNNFATPELARGIMGNNLDASWLRFQGPLTLTFSLLLIPWNILLFTDRLPAPAKGKAAKGQRAPITPRARARFVVGAITAVVGVAALFTVSMAYRTLADSRLGGAFVVLAFLAGALAIGGVMTAMLLGHWYLNTPTASGKPLEFVTSLLLGALVAELAFTLLLGPTTAHANPNAHAVSPGTTIQANGGTVTLSTPTAVPTAQPGTTAPAPSPQVAREAPLTTGVLGWLQLLMGMLAPGVLAAAALYLTRGRSFQSATGMLYLCVSFLFIGEVLARGLLLFPTLA